MSKESLESCGRRRLVGAAAVFGAGAVFPVVPLFLGGTAVAGEVAVEADIANLVPGQCLSLEWQGRPVWILRRTQEMLDTLLTLDGRLVDPASERRQQPEYCRNATRSIIPEVLVVFATCTHLGRALSLKPRGCGDEGLPENWPGGFFCSCRGSLFDYAGRAYRNQAAWFNLEVPPHKYVSATRVLIGEEAIQA